ncbi:MAG: hypothetical protein QG672_418 [Pseudomonadota bacterium]|nr:hypothetical protein [Pseudomonadota bacterium]
MIGGYESLRWGNIGSRWLPVTVTIGLALVLVVGLLEALGRAEDQAEKAAVKLTTRHMQTGLKLAVGEALLRGRSREVVTWAGGNPVLYLAAAPQGYKGRCDASDTNDLARGAWCFDASQGELLYRPRSDDRRWRLLGDFARSAPVVLRWRIVLGGQVQKDDVANINVSVQLVTQHAWLE